jgi:hypothetical protein
MPLAAKLWLAGLVLMLAAVVASFVGISMVGGDTFSTVRIGSVGGVAALGGIEIPDSARLVGARLRHSIMDLDPIAWAILEMPREDAQRMLRTAPLAAPDYDGRPVTNDWSPWDDDLSAEWRPDDAEDWTGASIGKERHEAWHVTALADMDEETSRVYLVLER